MSDDLKIKISVQADPQGAAQAKREVEEIAKTATTAAQQAETATNKWGFSKKELIKNWKQLKYAIADIPAIGPLFTVATNPVVMLGVGLGAVVSKARELHGEIQKLNVADQIVPISVRMFGTAEQQKAAADSFKESIGKAVQEVNVALDGTLKRLEQIAAHNAKMAEITGQPAADGTVAQIQAIDAAIAQQRGIRTAAQAQMGGSEADALRMAEEVQRLKAQADQDMAAATPIRRRASDVQAATFTAGMGFQGPVWMEKLVRDRMAGGMTSEQAMQSVRDQASKEERDAIERAKGSRAQYTSAARELSQFVGGGPVDPKSIRAWYDERQRGYTRTADEAGVAIGSLQDRREAMIRGSRFAGVERAAELGNEVSGLKRRVADAQSRGSTREVLDLMYELLRRDEELRAAVAQLKNQTKASRNSD